jgi:hypothetical protein
MSLEAATVKPEANFPAAHPYWAGLLLGAATIPVLSRSRNLWLSNGVHSCWP